MCVVNTYSITSSRNVSIQVHSVRYQSQLGHKRVPQKDTSIAIKQAISLMLYMSHRDTSLAIQKGRHDKLLKDKLLERQTPDETNS